MHIYGLLKAQRHQMLLTLGSSLPNICTQPALRAIKKHQIKPQTLLLPSPFWVFKHHPTSLTLDKTTRAPECSCPRQSSRILVEIPHGAAPNTSQQHSFNPHCLHPHGVLNSQYHWFIPSHPPPALFPILIPTSHPHFSSAPAAAQLSAPSPTTHFCFQAL